MKAFEVILLSLAVADLLVGLSVSTFSVYDITQGLNIRIKDPIEKFIYTMQYFAVCSSITHILGIGVERVLAVKFPLQHKRCSSSQKVKLFIAIIWIVAIILTLSTAFPSIVFRVKASNYSFVALYTLAATVFFFGIIFIGMYSYIIWKVIIKGRQLDKRLYAGTYGQTTDLQKLAKAARERALVFTCVLALMTFVGCTFPIVGIAIYVATKEGGEDRSASLRNLVSFWSTLLLISNSVLDPCVYFLKGYLENRTTKKKTSETELPKTLSSVQ